jgi:hypothetical protein
MRTLGIVLLFSLLIAPDALSISSQKNEGLASAQDEMVVYGTVDVRGGSNGNIVVIVDQSPGGPTGDTDGVPDLVFHFAPEKVRQKYRSISFDFQQASVFFSSRRLAVISRDGHVRVSLSLEKVRKGEPGYSVYGSRASDLPNTLRISRGLGLLREVPQRLEDGSYAPINLNKSFVGDVQLLSEADDCKSGGPGASQCSFNAPGGGGCSVTCNSGYYACCVNAGDCHCVKEKGGDEEFNIRRR